MPATIQTIQKPTKTRALDTSGNNNHGQIYSGRALEFDGVSDRFVHNGGTALSGVNQFADGVDWTFACWLKKDAGDYCLFVGNDANTNPMLLYHSGEYLDVRDDAGDYFRPDNAPALDNPSWYRVVYVASANSITIYANGVQYGDSAITTSTARYGGSSGSGTFAGSAMEFSGWGAPYSTRTSPYGGLMSDGQVWDAAWTADDVLYDYNNPEQLALNRGGTSLTNSNLKIWYPMNDGHRGQQSYILDASNTGLGDEMITPQVNRDFNGANNWSEVNNAVVTTVDGKLNINCPASSDYVNLHRDYVADLKAGSSYKYEFTLSDISAGACILQLDGGVSIKTGLGNGTHTVYHTGTSGNALNGEIRILPDTSGGVTFKIDNFSLKPVNDKNHATTVFYGDDEWNAADNNVAMWTAVNGSAATAIGGSTDGGKIVYGAHATSNHSSTLYLRSETESQDVLDADLTVGRQYRLQGLYATDVAGNGNRCTVAVYNGSWTYPNEASSNIVTATNILDNGTFDSNMTGWTENDTTAGSINRTTTGPAGHNGTHSVRLITAGSNETVDIHQTEASLTAGDTYLLTYWSYGDGTNGLRHQVYDNSNSANIIATANNNSGNTSAAWAKTDVQFTLPAGCTSVRIKFLSPHVNGTAYVDDVVLTKFLTRTIDFTATHATTNYLAHTSAVTDDYIAAVHDRNSVLDEVNQWVVLGADASLAYNADNDNIVATTTNNAGSGDELQEQGAQLPIANFTTLEIGRTYIVRVTLSSNTGTPSIRCSLGNSAVVSTNISTSPTAYVFEVTPTDITTSLRIYNYEDAAYEITYDNITVHAKCNLYYDDITFKEIGTATGWTDADQQLDIPQTALQSYNQLAWFGDTDTSTASQYVTVKTDITTYRGETVSFWFVTNSSDEQVLLTGFLDCGSYGSVVIGGDSDAGKIAVSNSNGSTGRAETTTTWNDGKWHHCVAVIIGDGAAGGSGDFFDIYINGEKQTVATGVGAYRGTDLTLIGARRNASTSAFEYGLDGCITEVSIWDNKFTQAEVSELYNDGKALNAEDHSQYSDNGLGYWRNNGLAAWTNIKAPGTNNGALTGLTETMLITAGADGSRDSQGFLMNRQRTTNSLNLDYKVLPDGQYGEVKDFNFHATTFSIAFWVKTPIVTTNTTIIDKYEDSGNLRALRVYITSSQEIQLQLSSNGSDNESQKTTDANLANDTWYHIALTYSSGTFAAYKNGAALSVDGNFSTVTSVEQNIAPLYIGRAQDGAKLPFEGEIDDLVVYEDVLTATEVKRNYNAGKRSHR